MRSPAPRLAVAAMLLALGACGHETVAGRSWQGPEATPRGAEYTPRKAMRLNVNGWVVLRCISTADFKAVNCVVVGEQPHGYGLADAALKMMANITTRHTETTGDTPPTAGEAVFMPLVFCEPNRPQRCRATQAELDAFADHARSADRLVRAHHCGEARAEAAAIGQAGLTRLIDSFCARP